MSGYGGGYPGNNQGYPGGAGGYPGQGGYPGAPPAAGGYPNSGYPGGAPQGGYGTAPPPQSGGYGAPQGQPGYGTAPPPQGYGAPQGAGGYGAPPYGGAPQVDPNIATWFRAVDQDNSGQITAAELRRALVNGNWSNFSEEACRLMIDMFDKNNTGSIDVYEFRDLFNYINQWKALFESIDRDRSGFIEFSELSQALAQMGYRFSPTFVQNLLSKFDSRTRRLTLDNFIIALVQIKRLTDSFRSRDKEMRGSATMAYEDFVGLALGCHR